MKVNSLSWAASDNLKQVRTSMNETGARVHEVRLLLVCSVECSGSGRDDMDGCLLPASDVVWCCYAWDVCHATSRWYGLMFVAVSSYLMMWGDVVVDVIVLMCCMWWLRWQRRGGMDDVCCRPRDVGWCCCARGWLSCCWSRRLIVMMLTT